MEKGLFERRLDEFNDVDDATLAPLAVQLRHAANESTPLYVERVDDAVLGTRALVVRGVLSPDECSACIDHMMNSSTMVPAHSRVDYRNNMRVLCSSSEFATEVYHRLLPALKQLSEDTVHVTEENRANFQDNGLGMLGKWDAFGVNDCFRMCYYNPGGHFAPHYDADYVVDPTRRRSLKTMMIYLNDDFHGGETNFLDEHQLHWNDKKQLYCAPEGSIRTRFRAGVGDALVFDHKILHEGGQVTSGRKYMMRSEIMYQKAAACDDGDEKMHVALQLLQKAKVYEGNGEMDAAVRHYSRAFKLFPELERHT